MNLKGFFLFMLAICLTMKMNAQNGTSKVYPYTFSEFNEEYYCEMDDFVENEYGFTYAKLGLTRGSIEKEGKTYTSYVVDLDLLVFPVLGKENPISNWNEECIVSVVLTNNEILKGSPFLVINKLDEVTERGAQAIKLRGMINIGLLSKYDIKAVKCKGDTFVFRSFKTAATIAAMKRTIDSKIHASSSNSTSSGNTRKQAIKEKDVEFHKLFYIMLDETKRSPIYDYVIMNQVELTVNNAQGKRVWVEFRYYNADNMSALPAVSSQYKTISDGAGLVKSFVTDSNRFYNNPWDELPLSALGLGNGRWNILVLPFVHVGTYNSNASSTVIGPGKVLHFSKYGDNVSEMTVTDYR